MPNTLHVYGASDDLVELDGFISDEFGCLKGTWTRELIAPDGAGLIVTVKYLSKRCTWAVGIAPRGDERDDYAFTLPDWNARFNAKSEPYSAVLSLDVPDGTILRKVK
jgi:hypothetical protein